MSDFTKNKIAFAVALLATLFTIYPLLLGTDRLSIDLYGLPVQVRHLYYCLALLLSCSVYFYGIQFLTERPLQLPQLLGDLTYGLALVVPPLYLLAYVLVLVAAFFHRHAPSLPAVAEMAKVISGLLGFAGTIWGALVARFLGRREKKSTAERFLKEELSSLAVARQLFESKNYDLSVIECFRAIEAALRKTLTEKGTLPTSRATKDLVEIARKTKAIEPTVAQKIDSIRLQRNAAAHKLGAISQEDAAVILAKTTEILSALASELDDDAAP